MTCSSPPCHSCRRPRPRDDAGTDLRSPAQRRADAFTELLRRYLASGQSPTDGGDQPHLHLHIDARDLRTDDTTHCPRHEPHSGSNAADTDSHPADNSGACNGNAASSAGGEVDWAAILHNARTGWLSWTGPLSRASARRIACDCTLTPIVLDDNDAPLNLGRTSRVVSRRLRRAVLARDHGCAFPGCGRPAEWTQVHHIIHWIDGGATDLDNLVMLCGHRHRLLHHSGWDVVMGTDRHPWFVPPVYRDPARTPIPAHGRASPPAAA